jgi:hypothetical protein
MAVSHLGTHAQDRDLRLGYEPSDVPITSTRRSRSTWENTGQRSAQSSVDNCYRDQAVTNAAQLADLLSREDVPVVSPSG